MLSSVFLFHHWTFQAFQASVGKAGSEPVLLALFGLILFVIASKVRRPISQLDIPQKMDTSAPVVGRLGRTDRVPSVQLHAVRSTKIIEIAKQAASS
jgi:hypothetical protein